MMDAVDLLDSEALEALPGAIRGAVAAEVLTLAEWLKARSSDGETWPTLELVGKAHADCKLSWKRFCRQASFDLLLWALDGLQWASAQEVA